MPATYDDVERVIRGVAGVASASIGAVEGTGRGRLHIRLAPGHDPDDVSQAVADALRQRFGLDIDPAAIRPRPAEDVAPDAPLQDVTPDGASVDEPEDVGVREEVLATVGARAGSGSPAPAPAPAPASGHPDGNGSGAAGRSVTVVGFTRPTIEGLTIDPEDLEVHVAARLRVDGRDLVGHASAAATRQATLRAVGRATLDAVEQLFPGRAKIELDALELAHDGQDEVATATVTFLTHGGSDKLIGVSIVRGDPERAVMRATLDAVNRRVGLLVEETVTS